MATYRYSDYILATFLLHFGFILAIFCLHSGYILATFWLHFGYILAILLLHSGYILATFLLHSGYILATFWLYSGYILATLLTADGAYHCPVGSTWPFFIELSYTSRQRYDITKHALDLMHRCSSSRIKMGERLIQKARPQM